METDLSFNSENERLPTVGSQLFLLSKRLRSREKIGWTVMRLDHFDTTGLICGFVSLELEPFCSRTSLVGWQLEHIWHGETLGQRSTRARTLLRVTRKTTSVIGSCI